MLPAFLCLWAAAEVLVPAHPLSAADSAVVLMYHRYGEDKYPSTNIRVEQFEVQLEHLLEGGYAVVPLTEVVNALTVGGNLPSRAVVITIDDAYRSVYDVAFPRFKAAGFPFTVFIATDPVDEGLPAYMTWDQMREMAASGATFADLGEFRTKVNSLPMPIETVEPWDPVVSTGRPSIEVTLGPTDALMSQLSCFVSGQGKVEVEWIESAKRFRVGPARLLSEGRHRVNCTAPRKDGRYLWFSHPWIIQPIEQ